MAEKYIDMKDEIRKDSAINVDVGIVTALRWLDRHPDRVPGRTITASEFIRAANGVWGDEGSGPNGSNGYAFGLAHRLGIIVVPDPEPTNAEKLKELYGQWLESDAPACRVSFHQFMDEAGVKAPGGDE